MGEKKENRTQEPSDHAKQSNTPEHNSLGSGHACAVVKRKMMGRNIVLSIFFLVFVLCVKKVRHNLFNSGDFLTSSRRCIVVDLWMSSVGSSRLDRATSVQTLVCDCVFQLQLSEFNLNLTLAVCI